MGWIKLRRSMANDYCGTNHLSQYLLPNYVGLLLSIIVVKLCLSVCYVGQVGTITSRIMWVIVWGHELWNYLDDNYALIIVIQFEVDNYEIGWNKWWDYLLCGSIFGTIYYRITWANLLCGPIFPVTNQEIGWIKLCGPTIVGQIMRANIWVD